MYDPTASVDSPIYVFTAQEVSRLTIYRAAMKAGYFSDFEPAAAPIDQVRQDILPAQ
jgi:hypothetical protein